MNARKAKALRRQAMDLTIGKPNVAYQAYRPPAYAPFNNGLVEQMRKIRPGIPMEMADCTRKAYKALKRGRLDEYLEFIEQRKEAA